MCSDSNLTLNQLPKVDNNVPWTEFLMKGAMTGAVAAAASYLLLGENRSMPIAGRDVPVLIPVFAGGMAGSVLADTAHRWVLPMIPGNEKYAKAESAALGILSSGAGTAIALSFVGTPNIPATFALGAGSYVASDFAYHTFIDKSTGGMLF